MTTPNINTAAVDYQTANLYRNLVGQGSTKIKADGHLVITRDLPSDLNAWIVGVRAAAGVEVSIALKFTRTSRGSVRGERQANVVAHVTLAEH